MSEAAARCCIMAAVKSHDDVWKDLLKLKGLSAVASVLEEYGLSCEADMSLLDETDLGALTSKLKPLQSNLLGKWVQSLATGGDRGVIVSGTPTASDTPSSSFTAPAVSSTETAPDKVGERTRYSNHFYFYVYALSLRC